MNLLVFCGKRRSGKTEAARLIVSAAADMGITFRKQALADPLRSMFASKIGIAEDRLTDSDSKEEYRLQMMEFSTEIKKHDPNYFIKAFFNSIEPGENVVCDDLRLDEELFEMVRRKGIIYKIECNDKAMEFHGFTYTKGVDDSVYENECANYSAYTYQTLGGGRIFNNGSLTDLRKEAVDILKEHLTLRQFSCKP